ncbi:potassium voltage-gated channel protein Shaw-like [Actinia tenebrosa]|uniref:Potassium voltage-gated channel protein Shaw-like n=1 Tax=Actinia tenebrosa TaxID=6105 RepID=A0A6P8H1J2_ACTTE|nr:potassium voltage-gated channel protein Shaw-like [Actinia tenebrosa]
MGSKKRLEIMPQVIDTTQKRITLNVGGQKHETYLSTIRNYPDTRLYWVVENVTKTIDYHSEKIELFFDRHPGIFSLVLNYYRTGKLHCPNDVCGPLFEEELAYWGIDEKNMEPCCWTSYIQHRDAENNLKSFNVAGDFEAEQDEEREKSKGTDDESDRHSSRIFSLWSKYKPKVWSILEDPRSSRAAKIFSIFSVVLVVLSVAASCAITLPQFSEANTNLHVSRVIFDVIEYVCGSWFTLEVVMRVVFSPNKVKLVKSWFFWIDLLSVVPFYVRLLSPEGDNLADALQMIRLLRLFRFFRLLYGLQVLLHTLKASSYELFLLLIILLIPVVMFSSIIFYVEKKLDRFETKFQSIPASFWFSLITMTTVGYGDMTPNSWAGKIIGGVCAIFGVLMVALPISIIGSNFNLYYAHAQARLKLPRKKNKFHFDSLTTAMARQALRRRAMRRKSPRWSGSEDPLSLCSRANSTVKANNFELLAWDGIASRKCAATDQTNNEVKKPSNRLTNKQRKLSRERRMSRNDRPPAKLGDLPEHEENENGLKTEKLPTSRLSLGSSSLLHLTSEVPHRKVTDDRSYRSRSYSMPLSTQNTQYPRPPRKYRSDSSTVCEYCSLPKDELDRENLPFNSYELCQCERITEGHEQQRKSSSFTLIIPSPEGTEDWVEVSSESVNFKDAYNPTCRSFSINSDNYKSSQSNNVEIYVRDEDTPLRTYPPDSDGHSRDLDSSFSPSFGTRKSSDNSTVPLLIVESNDQDNPIDSACCGFNHTKMPNIEIETSI